MMEILSRVIPRALVCAQKAKGPHMGGPFSSFYFKYGRFVELHTNFEKFILALTYLTHHA
jgi:hypothetical protein